MRGFLGELGMQLHVLAEARKGQSLRAPLERTAFPNCFAHSSAHVPLRLFCAAAPTTACKSWQFRSRRGLEPEMISTLVTAPCDQVAVPETAEVAK